MADNTTGAKASDEAQPPVDSMALILDRAHEHLTRIIKGQVTAGSANLAAGLVIDEMQRYQAALFEQDHAVYANEAGSAFPRALRSESEAPDLLGALLASLEEARAVRTARAAQAAGTASAADSTSQTQVN